MGNEQKQSSELDDFAFEIFKTAVAHSPVNRGGEQQARAAYRKAEAFIAVRDKVRTEPKSVKSDGPTLAEFCAPKRPRTDPHNMVSTRFGNLEVVNRVKKWLDANPTPENDTADIVHRFKSQFSELQWGVTEEDVFASINTARAIFPSYCKS